MDYKAEPYCTRTIEDDDEDYNVFDDENEEGVILRSIEDLTLSEMMGQEMDVWVTRNKKFGFDIQINNENGEMVANDKGIHPYATDAFADFCRRYLAFYDKASNIGAL